MMRYVAPAGSPLPLTGIVGACLSGERSDGLQAVAAYVGARHAFGTNSGRAALWVILKSLSGLRPERKVVAIPAYTCFSVPAAVVRAGLKIYPIDVDPESLELNYAQFEGIPDHELLCIVTANLFGYVNDLSRMEDIARRKDSFLLDDAAQALGASRDRRRAGTGGDVGFFSFARGKPLPTGEGGMIITSNHALAERLQEAVASLPCHSRFYGGVLLFKLLVTSAFLRPNLYWIPNAIPFLKLGITEYNPAFPVASLPPLSRGLMGTFVGGLDALNHSRRETAKAIAAAMSGISVFAIPQPADSCVPTFLRFPLLAPDEATRNLAVAKLRQAGIGASSFYPSSICQIEGIAPHMAVRDFHRPQAEELSRRILTLPTHRLVTAADIGRMAGVLRSVA